MNYRHAYHAGNFADVFKHLVVLMVLQHLRRKDSPFCCLDTHGGVGVYDLLGESARKTGEYRTGIARLLEQPKLPDELTDYAALVREFNEAGQPLARYPGSPALIQRMLRDQDRLIVSELHPEDHELLKATFRGDARVAVHRMDAYQALKAFVPPEERRGLVLVDPPFEVPDEFERMVNGLKEAHRRWATGIYALWYPIKRRRDVARFHRRLQDSGIPKILVAEISMYPEDAADRFNGCGMAVVNPPWQLDKQLKAALPSLTALLAAPETGRSRVEWLMPE